MNIPRNKSVVTEGQEIQTAVTLIELGARLQLLQEETTLSRERLLKLYREVKGEAPSKGMLPYSTDWFMVWSPNIHSSLFMDIYQFLLAHTRLRGIEALVKAYRLYLEHISLSGEEAVLSITRAWFLIRFFDAGMLQLAACKECGGKFVVHANELYGSYICGICRPPSRAGKTRKNSYAASLPAQSPTS